MNDGGTQVLMNGFYRGLQSGMTKAEALQQAQIALITGEYTAVVGNRGIAIALILDRLLRQATGSRSHPYYWASFILIGNGLKLLARLRISRHSVSKIVMSVSKQAIAR